MIENNIGLIGLGATGAPLADYLFTCYRDKFILLSDKYHEKKLNSGDIRINGRVFNPQVITNPNSDRVRIDILFICVKNYSLEKTCRDISNCIGKETIILPLQNGLYSYNYLRNAFQDNIILEGFVQGPNTKIYGNDIIYQNTGVYHLGKQFSGYKEAAEKVYKILKACGISCILEENIRHAIWKKLMLNVAGNTLTALTGLDYCMFRNSIEAQKICRVVMNEYKFIAASEDVVITDRDIAEVMEYFMEYKDSKYTSMLTDVMNKRRTENEYIAGYISRLAKKNGISAPFIDMLYSIMRIKEDVYLGNL